MRTKGIAVALGLGLTALITGFGPGTRSAAALTPQGSTSQFVRPLYDQNDNWRDQHNSQNRNQNWRSNRDEQ